MYKKIKCNEKHKKISIPEKVRTKLKMLATVATISGLGIAVATFSGCDVIINNIEQMQKPAQTSSYVQEMQETTQKFENATSNVKGGENEEIPTQEWEQYSNFIDEMQKRGMFEERHDNPLTQEEYNELLTNLNNVLQEKHFSMEAELLVRDTFESLCKNYHTWQNGYLDMPSAKDYISSNFINVIKTLKDINYIDINSDEANEIFENGETSGALIADENGENKVIRIIAEKKENDSEENRNYIIEEFAHEIAHCMENQNLNYLKSYYADFNEDREFMLYSSLLYLLSEGGATQAEQFTCEYTINKPSSWGVMNDDESIEINYTKSNGVGYILPLNPNEKLIMLLGYRTYDDIQKGNVPITTLESKMEHYYGKKGIELLEIMSEWNREYEANWKSDKVVQLSIRLENLFLELIEMNINNINNMEQLNRYKEVINHYVEKNLPTVLDKKDEMNITDITDRIFNMHMLKYLIEEKEFSLNEASQEYDDGER